MNYASKNMLGVNQHLLIGGEDILAQSGEVSSLINPATESFLGNVAKGGACDVDAAVTIARTTFDDRAWTRLGSDQRSKILWRVSELIEKQADQMALADTTQMGVPLAFSKAMVAYAAEAFRYYAGWCSKINGIATDLPSEQTGSFAYTRLEPVGVAGLIIPWNAPSMLTSWKVAACLAAGCSGVVKPSEESPGSALQLGRILLEAGVPPGVVNIVPGGTEAGASLAAHDLVDKISFTGSTATGRRVIDAAKGNFKRLTLELGGKSPCVIMADADLARAVPAAAAAMYFNSGQVCTAGQRIYAQRPVYEAVVAQLAQIARGIAVGDPVDRATVMGPLVSKRQFDHVCDAIDRARAAGAEIVEGGRRVGEAGYFYAPTVIAGANESMDIMREETFGPAVCVVPFDDPEELLSSLNDSQYGLAAYLWTNHLDRAHRMAASIRAGMIWINSGSRIDYNLPLGGFKSSGWGRENGRDGVEAYLERKSVVVSI